MKLMYVLDQFYLHGGIEKILAAKINSFIRDYGFTVHLVTSGQQGKPFVYELDTRVIHTDLGINYIENESFFSKKNLKKKLAHARLLKKEIDKIIPDIIISPSFSHDQYFLPFIKRQIPKIKEIHFSGVILPAKNSKPSALSLVHWFFKYYDQVVILNEDERQYFPDFKLTVIPNFVDCSQKKIQTFEREKTVITAGRIAPVKQFDHLLKAWSLIEKKNPDWKLKIYGDGESAYVDELKRLSSELGLATAEFPGSVNNLPEIMQRASVFTLSSANECFPMVLLEAKCAGLPVVSYDSPNGPRNIIKDGEDGLLVKIGDVQEFAKKLSKLMTDEQSRMRMSKNAFHSIGYFSKERVMRKWESLLKELTS